MAISDSQTFLRELDRKLWTAADKLRSDLDAAVYKHAVLGLMILKYVSDCFDQRQAEIESTVNVPASHFYPRSTDCKSAEEHAAAVLVEQEERDYYTKMNVFWAPPLACRTTLQFSAQLPPGSELTGRRERRSAGSSTTRWRRRTRMERCDIGCPEGQPAGFAQGRESTERASSK